MKKLIIIAVGLMLLALVSLVCGGGASGSGTGSAVAAGASCPDGWEEVRLGSVYHGVHFEVAGSDCECAGGSGFCASFEGQIHATIVDESLHAMCGDDFFGMPNQVHLVCATGGDVFLRWDGESNHVCAKFKPHE